MNVFIVHAHPDPNSFNTALKNCAVENLRAHGHEVKVSDLYAMKFKAEADADDFKRRKNDQLLDYQGAQKFAAEGGWFSDDIVEEQKKLIWAELIIFQFPFWWFSIPAILKGWVDRVFAYGIFYGGEKGLHGRKAMLSTTTGGPAHSYTDSGRGTISNMLAHVQTGMLEFIGLEVLPPFVAYSVARVSQAEREQYLEDYKHLLSTIK